MNLVIDDAEARQSASASTHKQFEMDIYDGSRTTGHKWSFSATAWLATTRLHLKCQTSILLCRTGTDATGVTVVVLEGTRSLEKTVRTAAMTTVTTRVFSMQIQNGALL